MGNVRSFFLASSCSIFHEAERVVEDKRTHLRRRIRGIENEISKLSVELVKPQVIRWFKEANELDWEVAELLASLRNPPPCIPFVCCCSYYPGMKAQALLERIDHVLNAEPGLNEITRHTPCTPDTAMELLKEELSRLEDLKKDLVSFLYEKFIIPGKKQEIPTVVLTWREKVNRLVGEGVEGHSDERVAEIRNEIEAFVEEENRFWTDSVLVAIEAPQPRSIDGGGSPSQENEMRLQLEKERRDELERKKKEMRADLLNLKALKKHLVSVLEEIRLPDGRKQNSPVFIHWLGQVDGIYKEVDTLFPNLEEGQEIINRVDSENYTLEYKLEKTARIIAKIKDLYSEGNELEKMNNEWETLDAIKNDLESVVNEQITVSLYRRERSDRVTQWLKIVNMLATEVGQVKAIVEIATIRMSIEEMKNLAKELRSSPGDLLKMKPPAKIPYVLGSHPTFLIGIEDHISSIFGYLKDDMVSVIGIYGMGGAGKTTLVKELVKRLGSPKPEVYFDLIIFVVVSQTPNIFNIQEEIGVRLGFSDDRGSRLPQNESERKDTLRHHLSERKFLLILDDVWEQLNLWEIGIPSLDSGTKSKVLLTTRKLDVCSNMSCDEKLQVDHLEEKDQWSLFCHKLGEGKQYIDTDEEIREIVERIVNKCGGLPLVIVTVARALANESNVQIWRDVERLLLCTPGGFLTEMDDIFMSLKISFDRLERNEYKHCLLFCALYPEDSEINTDQVIRYWIAEGLLDSTMLMNFSALEAFGRQTISILQRACLLEEGKDENHVKMHDSIRDMAIWLGKGDADDKDYKNKYLPMKYGGKHIIIDGDGVYAEKVVESAEMSSAYCNLCTLQLRNADLFKIPEELFSSTPNLRILNLSRNSYLDKLPKSLWSLKSLRYLDLSYTEMKIIPVEVGQLTSLQFLYLNGTWIQEVPVEVGQLTNLVVLDLSVDINVHIPYLAISSLPKLQSLELHNIFSSSSSDGGRMKDLNNLSQLNSISLTLCTPEDVKEIQKCDVLNRSIRRLQFSDDENLTTGDVSSVLSRLSNLRELFFWHCPKLEGMLQLPSHRGLRKLEFLQLYDLPFLSSFVVEGQWQLPNLRKLSIYDCNQLRDLGCLLQLPNLEELNVAYCFRMVELIPSSSEAATVATSSSVHQTIDRIFSIPFSFPKLKEIILWDLLSLESISKVHLHLPSLQRMEVFRCQKLGKLPVIQSENVATIKCEKQWWEQLQWEDAAHRDKFLFQEG